MTPTVVKSGRPASFVLVLVLVAGATASGCGYAEARARDFTQILRLEAGGALGFGVDTRLGGLLDFGLGAGYSWDAALLYGEPYAGKQLRLVAPGFCRRAVGPTRVWSHECPSALPPLFAAERYEVPSVTHLGTRLHEFDVEAGVLAGLVHIHVGFSPGELLDFFLGIATIDIAGDDRGQKPPPHVPPPPDRPAPPSSAPPPAPPTKPSPAPGPITGPKPPPRAPEAPPATTPARDGEVLEPHAPPRRRPE